MFSLFSGAGTFGLVLAIMLIITLLLIIFRIYQALSQSKISSDRKNFNNLQIIVMGVLGLAIGNMATMLGLYNASTAISTASDIAPSVIFGGFGIALKTSILGSLLFVLSAVGWLIVRKIQLNNQ